MVHMHAAEGVSFRVQEVHESGLSRVRMFTLAPGSGRSCLWHGTGGRRAVRGCLFGEKFYFIHTCIRDPLVLEQRIISLLGHGVGKCVRP